jgi:hypothetical protein
MLELGYAMGLLLLPATRQLWCMPALTKEG